MNKQELCRCQGPKVPAQRHARLDARASRQTSPSVKSNHFLNDSVDPDGVGWSNLAARPGQEGDQLAKVFYCITLDMPIEKGKVRGRRQRLLIGNWSALQIRSKIIT